MGNTACCEGENDRKATASSAELSRLEATPVVQSSSAPARAAYEAIGLPAVNSQTYRVKLDKSGGGKLGLDVDYMDGRTLLPIIALTGGLAEAWNKASPHTPLQPGDSICEVNGVGGSAAAMLEKCKNEQVLDLKVLAQMTYEHLVSDLEELIQRKSCGAGLLRLGWRDVGFLGCREDGAAAPLLSNISAKYCPALLSEADLRALAANVSIRLMGGPDIATRFGRGLDGPSRTESVDTSKGADHLREVFSLSGFDDKDVVALSGASGVGRCSLEQSGHARLDNSYFKNLIERTYSAEKTSAGKTQYKCAVSKTVMQETDMALIRDPGFRQIVEAYASDQGKFFSDLADCWPRLQECGHSALRDIL